MRAPGPPRKASASEMLRHSGVERFNLILKALLPTKEGVGTVDDGRFAGVRESRASRRGFATHTRLRGRGYTTPKKGRAHTRGSGRS